jgi:hypothetical protein
LVDRAGVELCNPLFGGVSFCGGGDLPLMFQSQILVLQSELGGSLAASGQQ